MSDDIFKKKMEMANRAKQLVAPPGALVGQPQAPAKLDIRLSNKEGHVYFSFGIPVDGFATSPAAARDFGRLCFEQAFCAEQEMRRKAAEEAATPNPIVEP